MPARDIKATKMTCVTEGAPGLIDQEKFIWRRGFTNPWASAPEGIAEITWLGVSLRVSPIGDEFPALYSMICGLSFTSYHFCEPVSLPESWRHSYVTESLQGWKKFINGTRETLSTQQRLLEIKPRMGLGSAGQKGPGAPTTPPPHLHWYSHSKLTVPEKHLQLCWHHVLHQIVSIITKSPLK